MKKSKVIAFWSPFHGQTGQTLSMAAAGCCLGINYSITTLLMHTHFLHSNLENGFLPPDKDIKSRMFDERGIDAVEKLARTKQLSEKSLTDYTTSLLPGRLEILTGTSKASIKSFTRLSDSLAYIIACARQSFDLVLCDVNSGLNSEITGIILKNADLVVVCLNQNLEVLKVFFDGHLSHPEIQNRKFTILLGNYQGDSIYTAAYIKKLFKYKEDIYTLPRNAGLMDAHNGHDLLKYFFTNAGVKKQDDNHSVVLGVERLAARIVQELDTDPALLTRPLKRQGLLELLGIGTKRGEK